MNPYEIPGGLFTLNVDTSAETDIPRGRFVKATSNGGAALAAAATDPIIGVSYTEAKHTQPLSIAAEGIVMVEASGAITAGDFVAPTTGGKAVKVSGSEVKPATGFVALTSAVDKALVTVKL